MHCRLADSFDQKVRMTPMCQVDLASASPWKRLVVLFAGPMMNLLTAVVVFSFLIGSQGVPVPGSIKIDAIAENSPAQQAGMQSRRYSACHQRTKSYRSKLCHFAHSRES